MREDLVLEGCRDSGSVLGDDEEKIEEGVHWLEHREIGCSSSAAGTAET